jgi:hypothetical protein
VSAAGGSRVGAAVLLGIVGGLLVLGGTTASWVAERGVEDVAGVPIESVEVRSGAEFAPVALPAGLAAVVVSLALALPVAGLRLVLGVSLVLLGGAAGVALAIGAVEAAGLGLGLEPAVIAAATGAVAVAAAGVLSLRPAPAPRLSARYDLDAEDPDDEWDLASAEDDPPEQP